LEAPTIIFDLVGEDVTTRSIEKKTAIVLRKSTVHPTKKMRPNARLALVAVPGSKAHRQGQQVFAALVEGEDTVAELVRQREMSVKESYY
jgi:hypothetical protein